MDSLKVNVVSQVDKLKTRVIFNDFRFAPEVTFSSARILIENSVPTVRVASSEMNPEPATNSIVGGLSSVVVSPVHEVNKVTVVIRIAVKNKNTLFILIELVNSY